jgi:hypothetical protein
MTLVRVFVTRGVTALPLKEKSRPEIEMNAQKRMGVGWLPRWKKLRVVGSQELLMFPRDFVFGVVIPLDLVKPSSLVAGDSVLLAENLNGVCLVRQIRFQWDGVFDNHICRRLQTFLELGDMKHNVHSR